ncbi:hypothetical protein Tco_0963071 [Tanacetum coccineum]
MSESSSQNPSSPNLTPKEEPVTLDKPESQTPFLPVIQVEFIFEEIAFTTNNELSKKEAFYKSPNQYKEYLSEFWYMAKALPHSRFWVSTPIGEVRGEIDITTFRNALRAVGINLVHLVLLSKKICVANAAFPASMKGNFIPRKPDLTFMDEIVESENLDVTTVVTPCNVKTVEDKGVSNTVEI